MELRDASEVWGMGVHDTVKHFQEKFGEKDLTRHDHRSGGRE